MNEIFPPLMRDSSDTDEGCESSASSGRLSPYASEYTDEDDDENEELQFKNDSDVI